MTKIKKKHKVLKIIIIVSAMLIVLLGVMRYLFGNKEVMFGANVNSMSYSKDISPQNYSSVDEAMKTVDEKLVSLSYVKHGIVDTVPIEVYSIYK